MRRAVQLRSAFVLASVLLLSACESTGEQRLAMGSDPCGVLIDAEVQTVLAADGATFDGPVTAIPNFASQTWASSVFVARDPTAFENYNCSVPYMAGWQHFSRPGMCERRITVEEFRGAARVSMNVPNAVAEADRIAEANCRAAGRATFGRATDPDLRGANTSCEKLAASVCSFAASPATLSTVTGYTVGTGRN